MENENLYIDIMNSYINGNILTAFQEIKKLKKVELLDFIEINNDNSQHTFRALINLCRKALGDK